jgi:hypothetical protein
MKSLKIFLVLLSIVILISCKRETALIKTEITGAELKSIIGKYLQGEESSKNKINGLFTYTSDDFNSYNKIEIDSITIDNVKYFSVLVENRIPVYNLFAIVDEKLNLYLKDESLNGFLNAGWKKSESNIYAVVDEDFRSTDSIKLNRISYYSFNNHAFDLVFRQFIKLTTPVKNFEQNITLLSDTTIYTEIIDNLSRDKKIKKDAFRFDAVKNKYFSSKNIFEALVNNEIANFLSDSVQNQITDYESLRKLLGLEEDTSTVINNFTINDEDFEIKLNNQWKKINNYVITNLTKKEVKGIKFINTKIGASISLFKTLPKDSANNYFNQAIETISADKKFKTSLQFENGKNIITIYEFNCPLKKVFILLEAPKSTYENNIEIFNAIIKSFKVNC